MLVSNIKYHNYSGKGLYLASGVKIPKSKTCVIAFAPMMQSMHMYVAKFKYHQYQLRAVLPVDIML
jgi:hypothetical protein